MVAYQRFDCTLLAFTLPQLPFLMDLFRLSFALKKGLKLIYYRKIPKISPGAYIFQRPFLRGLVLEGLIFGGAYLRREICVSKSIGLAL